MLVLVLLTTILAGLLIWIFFRSRKKTPSIYVDLNGPTDDISLDDYNLEAIPGQIQCFAPTTMDRLGQVPAMTKEDVCHAAQKARKAQKEWEKTNFEQRRHVLRILQKYIVENQKEICMLAGKDSGKTNLDALLGEVLTTCEKISYVCKHGEQAIAPESRPVSLLTLAKSAYVEYHPLGVLGVISPWNYPFHNLMNHIISGLFTGNAVVCKPSEHTTWSSAIFLQIVKEALRVAGHSPDVVQLVTGFAEVGESLVSSGLTDKIIFTGSHTVGKLIMKGAAPTLTPVVLELGGKDPMVLCEDIDVDTVLHIAMRGVYQNSGQNCCGVERIYAYNGVHDKFVDAAVAAVQELRQGVDTNCGDIDCGALVMPGQLDIIQALVDDAVAHGAIVRAGGKRNTNSKCFKGLFFEPTVLTNVTHDMRIAKEEVFGPVMTVFRVKDDDHLMELVNDCDFGLGSSVFSNDEARANRIGQAIRSGMTTINDFATNYLVQSLPFGGVKSSGFGRFAGPEGLKACCLQKTVLRDRFSFAKTTIPKVLQYPVNLNSFEFGAGLIGMTYSESLADKIKSLVKLVRAALATK